ncbi:hypothetical protein SAMN05444722_1257 [Rhodovulum sp. ES.010]|uniref:5-aminolevulic acid synthase n=1 Tax=Rhodovulum sp. ES.010 TaxID=1882821 RepID=UPI0009266EBB|nr:5-aminolevulic acid synthase [Rhodovulum sp. ES.010]SIO29348.1 hypothetical protein SAMN05444722_1257 [Rhodovulum sp. ES.010]
MKAIRAIMVAGALALPAAVSAQPVDGRTARALVYDPSGVEVTIIRLDFLTEQDDLRALDFAARQQPYYAAIAVAPGEGLMSNATVAAANYHDVGSARQAALKSCDSRRQGGARCVIAAEVRPLGWEPRRLSLSADATLGLRQRYLRGGRGEKAMAISPSTGIWSVAKGGGAAREALDGCARQSGAVDCELAVADR